MAGGAAVRPRGPRSDPRQAGTRPRGRSRRPLAGAGTRRPQGRGPASHALLLLSLALAGTLACAHGGARPEAALDAGGPADGVRLLYEARVTAADGRTTRFRLAVACRLPDRLRLEALGPAGGTRLVIATDGVEATAILVADRRYDRAPATPEGLSRWTGLPLGAGALGAILQGKPPCGESVPAPGGSEPSVSFHCDLDAGDSWARQVAAEGQAGARRIELKRVGDPAPARLDDRLFAPEIPSGFERADLALGGPEGAPPLLGADAGRP